MKSAQEVVAIAEKAIRANYPSRNACFVTGNPARHRRMAANRRLQLREWVAVLRVARDPSNATSIAQVTHVGPLPSHALRSRVLTLVKRGDPA